MSLRDLRRYSMINFGGYHPQGQSSKEAEEVRESCMKDTDLK
jgi:hypothetical protein